MKHLKWVFLIIHWTGGKSSFHVPRDKSTHGFNNNIAQCGHSDIYMCSLLFKWSPVQSSQHVIVSSTKCIARTDVTGPFWDYKNHNAGYCLSHELRLVAFVPTSLPWVFFSLVVGHLDLIGNQSRWYMCVSSIPIWSTEIFSTQLPASMVEKSSFSCIHQAQNSPSHLF